MALSDVNLRNIFIYKRTEVCVREIIFVSDTNRICTKEILVKCQIISK